MADSKISALPASTTPLAGTEVLPIVQSSTTRQVSVANLTAGRAISATQLTLTTGNLIVASGQGIDFSATSGSGTSELLADYEEGTWTPAPNSGTFSSASGQYTKIGRMVTLTFFVVVGTGGGTTMTAPIASAITTASGIYTDAQIFGAGTTSPTAVIAGNGNIIYFRSVGSTVAYSDITFTASATISGTLTYFV
jgi:hypothetical protein